MLKIMLTKVGLQDTNSSQWVALPVSDGELNAVYEKMGIRLGTENNELMIWGFDSDHQAIRESIGRLTNKVSDIPALNSIIAKADSLSEIDREKLSVALKTENLASVNDVVDIVFNLERYQYIPNVFTDHDIGKHLVDTDIVKIPEDVMRYVDLSLVGEEFCDKHNGDFSSNGYVYKLENPLRQEIDKSILQVLKLYSPLFPKLYERNEYGDLEEYPSDLSGKDATEHFDSIDLFVRCENDGLPERGLMEYFHGETAVDNKVYSAVPGVEIIGDTLYGVMTCQISEDLTDTELVNLTDYISGQYSDGWGEGAEQRPIKVADGELYISFWDSGDSFYIKTEDEFFGNEQSQGMGGIS